ncbi:MAG: hypothetical protein FJ388_09325, partial [Verrucomicrobia bacterium]|nr:hypothetical protein [Verrucomicrobiota bacterium]
MSDGAAEWGQPNHRKWTERGRVFAFARGVCAATLPAKCDEAMDAQTQSDNLLRPALSPWQAKAARGHNQSGLSFSPSRWAGAWTEVQTTLPQATATNCCAEVSRLSTEHSNTRLPPSLQTMKQVPTVFIFSIALCLATAAAENWPRFRGPAGTGHHVGAALPTKWSEKDILWRVELKGDGHSSPVNWEHRIFLTAATDQGRARIVLALDARDGRLLWEKAIPCDSPGKTHGMNSFATPTCATDGERVVAFFDKAGIHCFDLDGKPLWSQSLGEFPGPWGVAASPVFAGDLVIQNCDAQGASSIVALDKKTGKIVWRTP